MRLTPRCYAVTGLGYAPPWCVNAGFIVGDADTLIVDTGANMLAGQTILGYAQAAKPTNALRAINTEKHFDHIGGNGFLREQGIDLWGHSGISRTPDEFAAEIAEFNQSIPSTPRRDLGEATAFFHGTYVANPNVAIDGELCCDLGGCPVEILATPGHTATNLSIWIPEERVLFTGDCLIAEYCPNLDAGTPADWKIWLASLDRLEALHADFVVAGHGPVVKPGEVGKVIDTVRRVLAESIARGCSPTAYDRS